MTVKMPREKNVFRRVSSINYALEVSMMLTESRGMR